MTTISLTSCAASVVDEQQKRFHGRDRRVVMKEERGSDGVLLDSSTSSSIGKNSDDDGDSDEEKEVVQSSYKCKDGSFDSVQALEEALPIRRGMSRFYNGRSKSFTSLPDASSSFSINEIAKPDNSYHRRRRNLVASSLFLDKNSTTQLKISGGVSKKSTSFSRNTLSLAVPMSSPSSPRKHEITDDGPNPNPNPNLISRLSPKYPQFRQSQYNGLLPSSRRNFSAMRSFSYADVQHCASLKAPAPAPAPR